MKKIILFSCLIGMISMMANASANITKDCSLAYTKFFQEEGRYAQSDAKITKEACWSYCDTTKPKNLSQWWTYAGSNVDEIPNYAAEQCTGTNIDPNCKDGYYKSIWTYTCYWGIYKAKT